MVDNAIDADATYIKIILYEYGKQKIEVIDNGFGIENFDFLGKVKNISFRKAQLQRIKVRINSTIWDLEVRLFILLQE